MMSLKVSLHFCVLSLVLLSSIIAQDTNVTTDIKNTTDNNINNTTNDNINNTNTANDNIESTDNLTENGIYNTKLSGDDFKSNTFNNTNVENSIAMNIYVSVNPVVKATAPQRERLDKIRLFKLTLKIKDEGNDKEANANNIKAVAEAVKDAIIKFGNKAYGKSNTANFSMVLNYDDHNPLRDRHMNVVSNKNDDQRRYRNKEEYAQGQQNVQNLQHVTQLLESVTNNNNKPQLNNLNRVQNSGNNLNAPATGLNAKPPKQTLEKNAVENMYHKNQVLISDRHMKVVTNKNDDQRRYRNKQEYAQAQQNVQNLHYVTQLLESVTNNNNNPQLNNFNRAQNSGNNLNAPATGSVKLPQKTQENIVVQNLALKAPKKRYLRSVSNTGNTKPKLESIYDPVYVYDYDYDEEFEKFRPKIQTYFIPKSGRIIKKKRIIFKSGHKDMNLQYESLHSNRQKANEETRDKSDDNSRYNKKPLLRKHKKYEATNYFNYDIEHITGCIDDGDIAKCKPAKNSMSYSVITIMPNDTGKYLNNLDDTKYPFFNQYNYKEKMQDMFSKIKQKPSFGDSRKRLPHFMPKRWHWEGDVKELGGTFWYNSKQGKYFGPYKSLLI